MIDQTPALKPRPAELAADAAERAQRTDAEGRKRHFAEALAALKAQLGRRYWPENVGLSAFAVYHAAQAPVLQRLRGLIDRLPAFCAEGRGLIFLGSVGTGKDHLLATMLYHAAAADLACRWCNGQELYGRFRDSIDAGQREELIFAELCRPQVLAVSDPIPPAAAPTAFNVQQLYRLLDRRYRDLKSTWVSVNALSEADADAKLSAPVFDRLREGAELFRCFWPSWRERNP